MADYNPVLTAPYGANKKDRRVGRGSSSGRGSTAGRGNKGQQSRSGGKVYVGFEGGQMPLYRRIARRGFSNFPFKKEYVDKKTLIEKGLLKGSVLSVKILANGEITKKLTFNVEKVSESAKAKIEKAGGTVNLISAEKKE